MSRPPHEVEPLLMPHEVAALFRVAVKTVASWETTGKLTAIRTIGNLASERPA